jgi:hypothetical protein
MHPDTANAAAISGEASRGIEFRGRDALQRNRFAVAKFDNQFNAITAYKSGG